MKVLGSILLEWSSVRHPVCCPDLYAWYYTGTKCFPASSEFVDLAARSLPHRDHNIHQQVLMETLSKLAFLCSTAVIQV